MPPLPGPRAMECCTRKPVKTSMRSVVHAHREVHDDFACRIPQDLPEPFIQVQFLCRKIKPSSLGFPGIDLLLEGDVSALLYSPVFSVNACAVSANLPASATRRRTRRAMRTECGGLSLTRRGHAFARNGKNTRMNLAKPIEYRLADRHLSNHGHVCDYSAPPQIEMRQRRRRESLACYSCHPHVPWTMSHKPPACHRIYR